jgi:hypothetical protein
MPSMNGFPSSFQDAVNQAVNYGAAVVQQALPPSPAPGAAVSPTVALAPYGQQFLSPAAQALAGSGALPLFNVAMMPAAANQPAPLMTLPIMSISPGTPSTGVPRSPAVAMSSPTAVASNMSPRDLSTQASVTGSSETALLIGTAVVGIGITALIAMHFTRKANRRVSNPSRRYARAA